jgi:hypothetical protein
MRFQKIFKYIFIICLMCKCDCFVEISRKYECFQIENTNKKN